MKKKFTKILSFTLALLFIMQSSGKIFADSVSQIVGSNFDVNNQASNFQDYEDKDWVTTFPNGTFILEYSQYTVKEGGENGTDTYLGINIARFGGKNSEIKVSYLIIDITTTPDDYELNSDSVTFEPGEAMKTVYIKIKDNKIHQTDRYFTFTLVDAEKAHIGDFNRAAIKIEDDEPVIPTKLKMYAAAAADKGDGKFTVDLTRTEGVDYYFTVDIATSDSTAKADEDYLAVKETVMFSPGEATKSVDIPLIHSDIKDLSGNKKVTVSLSNPKGGEIDGSDSVTVSLTNKIPDPSYIKVNSEVLKNDLGDNDKSSTAVSGEESITTNNTTLSVSKEKITTRQKLSMFVTGMSGGAIMQLSSITAIPTEDVIISERKNAPSVFPNKSNVKSSEWTQSNPIVDENDYDHDVWTDNIYNFNEYYQVNIDWGNNGKGTASETTLYFKNNARTTEVTTESAFGGSNYGHQMAYYPLDPTKTDGSGDAWTDYAGTTSKTSGLKFHIDGRGGWVPANYFYIEKMSFLKAIIPFERLMPSGATRLSSDDVNYLEYTAGGYDYTISLADSGNGSVALIGTKKGFVINSDLKVIVKGITAETSMKTPTALYIKDEANYLHNYNKSSIGTVFTKTVDGYVANINLSTINSSSAAYNSLTNDEKTSNNNANGESHIISGRYTNLASRDTNPEVRLHFDIDTVDTKTIQVQYTNASKLFTSSGKAIADLVNQIVIPQSSTTYFAGTSNAANCIYDLGTLKFSSLNLNSAPALLAGKKVNIKILGTVNGQEINFDSGSKSFNFADLPTSITIVLSDPSVQQFDPIPILNNPGAITVSDDSLNHFVYDKYITYYGFSILKFETVHSADSVGTANGGLAFDLNFTSPNLYPPDTGTTPLYFKVVVKKQNTDGTNTKELFSFVYEADTSDVKKVSPLSIASSMREVDIQKKGKNTYSVAIQSKFDYSQNDQVGQVFLGDENIVVEVYKKDTLTNLNNNVSKTNIAKSISGDQTVTIMQKLPTDKMTSDSLNYSTTTQKGQDSLLMYKDNTSTMDLPSFNFDLTGLAENFGLGKKVGGNGNGISINGDQLTIAFSLSGQPLEDKGKRQSGVEQLKALKDQVKSSNAQSSNAANPVNTPKKKSLKESAEGKFSIGGGFAITLKYDSVTSNWVFDNMLFGLTISGGIDINQQFAACPIFYYHMQATFTLSMTLGFKQVPIGYWDKKMQRKVVFAGFSISPSIYLSVGVGAGISGVLGVELSAYITAGLTATFGATEVTMANNIYDFDKENTDIFSTKGSWESETDDNSYKHTVLTTSGKKAGESDNPSITYTVDAYLILIKGSVLTNGGDMQVKITNKNGETVVDKTVSTKNAVSKSDCTLFSQNLTKRDMYTVTITYLATNEPGAKIALDETNYRTLEGDEKGAAYETKTKPATLDAWNVQFGLKIDIYLLIFSFSIDLIYFYVNQDGYGWGYPYKQKQIDSFSARKMAMGSQADGESDFLEELPRGTNYIDYTAQTKTRNGRLLYNALQSAGAKYDLGGAANGSLQTIAGNVMQTTSSKIYQIGNDYIMFWTIDDLTRTADQRSAIVYSINGSPAVVLDEDGLLDGELAAGINADGKLQVVWASSSGTGIDAGATALLKLEQIQNSMLLKTCTINLATKSVSTIKLISGTDDGRRDTLPAFASKNGKNVIVSVKDVKTEFDANVKTSYTPADGDEEGAQIASNLQKLQNSEQTGVNKAFYSIDTGNGYSAMAEIPFGISDKLWRAGTKITSNSVEFLSDNTVLYTFTAEIPNAQKGGFSGVDKMLFVQKGVISGNSINFSDGAICVDEIFDYDESLGVVFANTDVPEEYYEHIDGTATGTDIIENPVISNVMFKKVSLPVNGGQVTTGLTLFYKNKSKLYAIKQSELLKAIDLSNKDPLVLTPILTMATDDYDLNATENGDMYIIYNNLDENALYDSAMMLRYYDKDTGLWGEPKQLTYNNSYSQVALDNGVSGVYAVNFKKISSYIDKDGAIRILTLSTASEFKYENYTPQGESKAVRLAYLDAKTAKRNIDLITYSVSKLAAFEGKAPVIDSDLVVSGENSIFTVTAKNTSDAAMNGGKIELICRLANGNEESFGSKSIDGLWVSGAENSFEFIKEIAAGSGNKYNNSTVYYKIYDAKNTLVYNSYDENQSYTIKQDKPEILVVSDSSVIKHKADGDYIAYTALIKNIGYANPTSANLTLSVVETDENFLLTEKGAPLIKTAIPLDKLATTATYNEPTNYSLEIKAPAGMTESYKVRAVVTDVNDEVNLQNNIGSISLLYPTTELLTGYENVGNIITATVGDEITMSNFSLASGMYSYSDIVFEEADTNYLSIDNQSNPSVPKIKIMRGPDTGYKTVTLNIRIRNTNIVKALKINVSKRKIYNFGDSGITLNKFSKIASLENYLGDVVISSEKDSTITFDIKGSALELYGNKLANTGKCKVDIYDGASLIKTSEVDTVDSPSLYDASLYKTDGLNANKTLRVVITSLSAAPLILDRAEVDGTVADLPASAAYSVLTDEAAVLDLPMQNGRLRTGTVSFDFDSDIALLPTADPSGFKLRFSVIGIKGSSSETLANAEFSYSKIDGKTLYFTCDELASSASYDKVVYNLLDTSIPAGFIKAVNDSSLKLAIPRSSEISYVLTESKISKAEIVDVTEAGKYNKGILVTFEKPMEEARLLKTKLSYALKVGSNTTNVAFTFEKLTDNNKALYTMDKLELARTEDGQEFTFINGIVLSNNFSLISADGNYVDHVISVTENLSFSYQRAKATAINVWRDTASGERISASVTFDKKLDAGALTAGDASLIVQKTIERNGIPGAAENITLHFSEMSADRYTILFTSDQQEPYKSGDIISYTLAKTFTVNSEKLKSVDGEYVNNKVSVGADAKVQFGTEASITHAELTTEKQTFAQTGNKPLVTVNFSTLVKDDTLTNTSVSVKGIKTVNSTVQSKDLSLHLLRIDKFKNSSGTTCSKAIYSYQGSETFDFSDNVTDIKFEVASTQIAGTSGSILNSTGGVVIENSLNLPSGSSSVEYKIPDAPVLTIKKDDTVYDHSWSNLPLTASVSGAGTSQYKTGNGSWTNFTGNLPLSSEGETSYSFRLLDANGIASKPVTDTVKIDMETAAVTVSAKTSDNNTYTGGQATKQAVTFTVSQTTSVVSGIKSYYYNDGEGFKPMTGNTLTVQSDGTVNRNNYTFKAVSNSTIESTATSPIAVKIQPVLGAETAYSVFTTDSTGIVGTDIDVENTVKESFSLSFVSFTETDSSFTKTFSGSSLLNSSILKQNFKKYGTDNANSKFGITLSAKEISGDLSDITLSSTGKSTLPVKLYTAAALEEKQKYLSVTLKKDYGEGLTQDLILNFVVTNDGSQMSITLPMSAIETSINGNDITKIMSKSGMFTIANNSLFPVDVSVASITPKSGGDFLKIIDNKSENEWRSLDVKQSRDGVALEFANNEGNIRHNVGANSSTTPASNGFSVAGFGSGAEESFFFNIYHGTRWTKIKSFGFETVFVFEKCKNDIDTGKIIVNGGK